MHMRTTVRLVIFGMALLLAGCSSLNPFASKKSSANVPAELTQFKQTLASRTAWSASVGSAGSFIFSPAYSDGSVYAASSVGTIVSIDAASGREQWRTKAGMTLTAGVGADSSTVAVVGEKGVLLAYDAQGNQRWKAQVSSEVLSAPAVGQGLVIVRSVDNRISAYDAQTGARKWIVQRSAPPLVLRSAPGMVMIGPTVIVAMPGGRILSIALHNGGVRWELAVGEARGTTELERIADISGFPVIYGREVCAVAYQGRIGCADVVNGAVRWGKSMSSPVGLGIDERFVYAADDKGGIYALTRESGQSVWRNDKLAHRQPTTPVSFARAVALGDGMGYVHFLAREDGALVGRIRIDSSAVLPTPILAGNKIIVQTAAGTLAAISTE